MNLCTAVSFIIRDCSLCYREFILMSTEEGKFAHEFTLEHFFFEVFALQTLIENPLGLLKISIRVI